MTSASSDFATPTLIAVREDAWGRLVACLSDGTEYAGVEPVRAFPWSARHEWIVLVASDGEVVTELRTLQDQPASVRELVERRLAEGEFVPNILRIEYSSNLYAPCVWTVQTDRGRVEVTIDSSDDVRQLVDRTILITDASGVRYSIRDSAGLDPHSQRHLRRLL